MGEFAAPPQRSRVRCAGLASAPLASLLLLLRLAPDASEPSTLPAIGNAAGPPGATARGAALHPALPLSAGAGLAAASNTAAGAPGAAGRPAPRQPGSATSSAAGGGDVGTMGWFRGSRGAGGPAHGPASARRLTTRAAGRPCLRVSAAECTTGAGLPLSGHRCSGASMVSRAQAGQNCLLKRSWQCLRGAVSYCPALQVHCTFTYAALSSTAALQRCLFACQRMDSARLTLIRQR